MNKNSLEGFNWEMVVLSNPIKQHQHPSSSSSSPFPAAASLLCPDCEMSDSLQKNLLPFSHQWFCLIVGDFSGAASVNVVFFYAERVEVTLVITVLKIIVITSPESLSAWILLCDVTYEYLNRQRGALAHLSLWLYGH